MTSHPQSSATHARSRRRRVAGILAVFVLLVASWVHADTLANLRVLTQVLAHIQRSYVLAIDEQTLISGAIRGLAGSLDPHSQYLDPWEYRQLIGDTSGRFVGVGVEVEVQPPGLLIVRVLERSPAAKAGILPGDRLLAIDGRETREIRLDEVMRRMRGEPGTPIRLRLQRPSRGTSFELTLSRALVKVHAVEAKLLPKAVGYIKIRAFQDRTAELFRDALDALVVDAAEEGGLQGVLLDLRDNTGGLFDESVHVADEFIGEGLIVSTKGRSGKVLSEEKATLAGTRPNWPIVVLTNGYTASAAEIVAGALQDHHRATLVGTRTFGKGSVQQVIGLSNGGALKLTIALYYTPRGRSIQAEGISPDIAFEVKPKANQTATSNAIREATLEGHLPGKKELASKSERQQKMTPDDVRLGVSPSDVAGQVLADDEQAELGFQVLLSMIRRRLGLIGPSGDSAR